MSLLKTAGRHAATATQCEIDEPEGKAASVRILFHTDTGEEITAWLSLKTEYGAGKQKSAFDITLDTLRSAFGFDDNFETLPSQVEGKECDIVTEFETYNGKERLRVKFVNPPGGGMKAATPPRVSTLAALSAQAKRIARPAGAPKPAPVARPATSDRPF
jgi:hypothetical protein